MTRDPQRQPIWSDRLLADPHAAPDKAERLRMLFDLVAPRYDLANAVISLGLSEYARFRLVRRIRRLCPRPHRVLDLCCGPATLSKVLARTFPHANVVGADFSFRMLQTARRRTLPPNHRLAAADAMALPFANRSFDLVTCAYGLRNFADLDRGLREIGRVLKPGGRLVALDFQIPRNRLFRPIFTFYFRRVLPLVGGLLTGSLGSGAYHYLPSSVANWHSRDFLLECLRKAGFHETRCRTVGPDVMVLLTGAKPPG